MKKLLFLVTLSASFLIKGSEAEERDPILIATQIEECLEVLKQSPNKDTRVIAKVLEDIQEEIKHLSRKSRLS